MDEKPTFYIVSTDDTTIEEPRACFALRRIAYGSRDDYLVVKIDPPLIGQEYGLGGKDIDVLVVAAKHQGVTLFPIKEWPVYVYVFRPLIDPSLLRGHIPPKSLQMISWSELHPTMERAIESMRRSRS